MNTQLSDFIEKYALDTQAFNFKDEVFRCIKEMETGLSGSSSFRMILSYIKLGKIKKNIPVCVIDAGGSNLRVGRATITDKGFQLEKEVFKTKMIGTEGPVSGEIFFDRLSDYCLPFVNSGESIAFCFSFPAEIMPNLDAKILMFDKEVEVIGLDGQLVGKGLHDALAKKGIQDTKVYVINDTVATCLAGMAEKPGFETYAGTILGTGFNSCYFEKMSNINKTEDNIGQMIINMEAGGYAKLPRNPIDIAYDKTLRYPGHQLSEQLISGGYLGHIISATLNQAAKEGIIKVNNVLDAETPDVDLFIREQKGIIAESVESRSIKDVLIIIKTLINRAAYFAAIIMCAMIQKTKTTSICMTIEGSTYYHLLGYKEQTDAYILKYAESIGTKVEITEIDNAVLKGCAIAALLQEVKQ